MIGIFKKLLNKLEAPAPSKANVGLDNFSNEIYTRHYADVKRELTVHPDHFATAYDHYLAFGKSEERRRTYRRISPGQSISFQIELPEMALSGIHILLGVEKADASDSFDLILLDRGKIFFRRNILFGSISLDRGTDVLTGSIIGLSTSIEARITVDRMVRNDLWLMTTAADAEPNTSFQAIPFHDDPDDVSLQQIGVVFSPVSQCNQNCPHCISKFSRKNFTVISDKSQNEIRNLASSGRIRMLSVDYSGDAFFTNARYFPIFYFIDSLGCPFRIDTNGAYVDEDTMRRVARGHLHGINFSLDAATADTHSRLRPGKIGFNTIVDNIKRAVDILNLSGRNDVITSANFALMHSNIHEALPFVDLVHDLGLKNVVFSQVHVYQPETKFESLMDAPHLYNDIYNGLVEKLISKKLGFSVPPLFSDGLETSGRTRCNAPWNATIILANGDVQACCVPGTKIGNLNESTFDEVWSSKAARDFRREAASPDGVICSKCAYNGHRGVPASMA